MIPPLRLISPNADPVQPATELETFDALQWNESQKALGIADAIALYAFNKATCGDLAPKDAALCRYLGTHALRMTKPEWTEAANEHAAEQAAAALTGFSQEFAAWPLDKRRTVGLVLSGAAVSAFHGITEGLIALRPEQYLRIARDRSWK